MTNDERSVYDALEAVAAEARRQANLAAAAEDYEREAHWTTIIMSIVRAQEEVAS